MAISKFPSDFSVEPIFTMEIDQWPRSYTTLPSPLPAGNYRMDTEYATDTFYVGFLESDGTLNQTVTVPASSNRSIFFTLTALCPTAITYNSTTAATARAIFTVTQLRRGLRTDNSTGYPWEAYELPDWGTVAGRQFGLEIVGDNLYIIGGNAGALSWNAGDNAGALRSLDLTDLANPTWTTHISHTASGAVLDGLTYTTVIGTDIWFQNFNDANNGTLYKWDTVGASLFTAAAMPAYADGVITPIIADSSGSAIYKYGNYSIGATVGKYVIGTDTWSQLNNLPAEASGQYGGYHNYHTTDPDKIILRGIDSQANFVIHNLGADTYTIGASVDTAVTPRSEYQSQGRVTPNNLYYVHQAGNSYDGNATVPFLYNKFLTYPINSITGASVNASLMQVTEPLFTDGAIGFFAQMDANGLNQAGGSSRIAFHSSGDMWVGMSTNLNLDQYIWRLPAEFVPDGWLT